MIPIDQGHQYELGCLDGGPSRLLTFVKREGDNYPGNKGHYGGTTIQEVLRVCIDRLTYLEGQSSCVDNAKTLYHLERAIFYLERRAAHRHKRTPPTLREACYGPQCPKCLHVGCEGTCHPG